MDSLRKLTTKASNAYDSLIFNDSNAIYNQKAPDPMVTFVIGATFSAVAVYLWCKRLREIRGAIKASDWSFKLGLRAMISAAIDIDSPVYTIVKTTCQSFLFLAGIQVHYELALVVMLVYCSFEAALDAFRTWLCFVEYQDFNDLVVTSHRLRTRINNNHKTSTQLTPSNVYEDLSRDPYIVVMVFITQALLISFVVRFVIVLQIFVVSFFVVNMGSLTHT